ncbi:MAG: FkbM family methyltransferase [Kiritimatiellae bacterium]|nr:FkbM family methyltransferase [Kiritimatiellia bacterium]
MPVNEDRSLGELRARLRFVWRHPLCRRPGERVAALSRFLRWHLHGVLGARPLLFRFVNDSKVLLKPGVAGRETCYVGLAEFAEMAFVLHVLAPDDLFVDVGANIGLYTILAGAGAGARCIAVEPVPSAREYLTRNVELNGLGSRVECVTAAVGRETGRLRLTAGLCVCNHVVPDAAAARAATDILEAPAVTLDELVGAREPVLVKIDVEGYESEVIAGAPRVLSGPSLLAIVVELHGLGARYGHDETQLRALIREYGFQPFVYHPFDRTLTARDERARAKNTLFIRDPAEAGARLKRAPAFRIFGREI